jgi:hypothetical protein
MQGLMASRKTKDEEPDEKYADEPRNPYFEDSAHNPPEKVLPLP